MFCNAPHTHIKTKLPAPPAVLLLPAERLMATAGIFGREGIVPDQNATSQRQKQRIATFCVVSECVKGEARKTNGQKQRKGRLTEMKQNQRSGNNLPQQKARENKSTHWRGQISKQRQSQWHQMCRQPPATYTRKSESKLMKSSMARVVNTSQMNKVMHST